MLDHSPHHMIGDPIWWAIWLELWPYLAGGAGVVALVVMIVMIIVDLVKAYRRGKRARGEE